MLTYSEAKSVIKELDRSGLVELIDRMDEDGVKAGLELGISPDNLEEAYQGKFSSDREFAQDMADQLGSINVDAVWPYTCIDWDYAAKELMYDYYEQDGYYFRKL